MTSGIDGMYLQIVVTYKYTAATSQKRLELVHFLPYVMPGDEVQLVEWTVNDEVLKRKLERQVFRPEVSIIVQKLVVAVFCHCRSCFCCRRGRFRYSRCYQRC